MSNNGQESTQNVGRPKIRERPDMRVTIRLRYHRDMDLIEALEQVPSRGVNAFVRKALREWLQAQGDVSQS